ncbi:hypothetical protein [Gemmatimonas sp.]|uniref:hypothetical protein n=1 Tax=Gemmatimonas sp. TaxID=1962908 RepID=UPI0035639457
MLSLASQLLLVADSSVVHIACESIADEVALVAIQREAVLTESAALCVQIQELALAMKDPEDEAELYRSLAALWLEMRFQWQRHNLVANYDTMLKGTCEPLVLARASAASYILGRIEGLLSQDHRDRLSDTAVELLEVMRADVERDRTGGDA